ncbi:MAG: hypothetical protein M9928_13660 [Anaerolineae bacterium]|nr:hypothetical protein [Anaerolineae bacterium]MCO5192049.1 hypothetical protein [Anaerolineae bacterium]MCO5206077.1 hypothetical protein [Anaerolineae bacterium]
MAVEKADTVRSNRLMLGSIFVLLLVIISLLAILIYLNTQTASASDLDSELRQQLADHSIVPLDLGEMPDEQLAKLGQLLFFDKVLSGNRDISCATCHHPLLHSSDGLSLSLGTGGRGLGKPRLLGDNRALVPRNAPEVFNRGASEWHTMFWDGRVALDQYAEDGELTTPAKELLPDGLTNALAAQAMFPVTSATEMRGSPGDRDVYGNINEIAMLEESDLPAVWELLTKRLLAIPEYRELFAAAYPDVAIEDIGFQHAANAIAAFEIAAFSFDDSPWDRYVAGDDDALSDAQKEGAVLFYGKAGCANCHAGTLQTDQEYHNLAVPQLGPGKNPVADGLDFGRFLQTNDPADRFAFRTPPLRNIALTAPYFHNGAYITLSDTIRHHFDPETALATFDVRKLDPYIWGAHRSDEATQAEMLGSLDPLLETISPLNDTEFDQLLLFMDALTSPSCYDLNQVIPNTVPSGLPVDD